MISDPAPSQTSSESTGHNGILAIVMAYAMFALMWILFSDMVVEWLFRDPSQIIMASVVKGGLFVAVTSWLLYRLMRRRSRPVLPPAPPAGWLRLTMPFLLLAVAILALTVAGINHAYSTHHDKEVARLEAIADLKAQQISDWLRERQGDAYFVQSSQFFADSYRRWREAGDQASAGQLQSRLEQLRQNRGFAAILLMDPRGERIWGSTRASHELAPPLREAVRRAVADQQVSQIGPYLDLAGHMRLDFVAPLKAAGDKPPLVVMQADPGDWLFYTLQIWPVPSTSGEILLFRRDGDQVLFLNELRHRRDTAMKLRVPVATPELLAGKVLRGEAKPGDLVEGVDYRGMAVMGVTHAIPGTDWYLAAKLDRREVYAEAKEDMVWVALSGTLALLMVAAAIYLMHQRQQLGLANRLRQSQEEQLQALGLLAAISESSDDAIFAKDLGGHYILFNRAACGFVGKPAEEVLGRDDSAIFPAEQADMLMAIDRRVVADNQTDTREEILSTEKGERIFLATKGPLRNSEGEVIGTFGISRDITEYQQAEKALLASEMSYRSLFENMMNGYAHCLMLYQDGKPWDFTYLDVNRAFEVQTGLRDVVGRKVSEIIPGIRESDPGLLEIYGRVAQGGQPERFETYVEALEMWFSIMVYSPQRDHFVAVFDVITERKQAELALQESESRFRALVEQSLAGIYIIQDGHFRYVNPGFAAMFGYGSPQELTDRVPVTDLVSPQDRPEVMENIRQRIDAETADIHYSFTGLRRDGNHIDVEVHGRAFDYQGRPAVIGLVLDITARKAAEDMLRASELRFHDIVNASADWVWEVDAEGRYTYASESVHDLLGYTPAEIIGRTPFDLMPPAEAEKVRAEFSAIVARREPFRDLDNITVHKDGSLRHVQTNGMPILDEDGKLLGFRGLDRDVTEKRLAEERLRISEERLQLALNATNDGLWDWDLRSGKAYLAPHYYEMTGYRPDEVVPDFDFFKRTVHPDDLPMVLETMQAHLEGKTASSDIDYRIVTPSGQVKWIAGRGQVVERDADGAPLRMVGTIADISARKTAEESLRQQTEELARRNEELERFNRATVGRELDMIALKQRINDLSRQLGQEPPYPLSFIGNSSPGPGDAA